MIGVFGAFLAVTMVAAGAAYLGPTERALKVSAVLGLAQTGLLVAASLLAFYGRSPDWRLWTLAGWGGLNLRLTSLGAFFVLAEAIVYAAVWLYSPGYLRRYREHPRLRQHLVVLHLLMAAVALVFTAGDVVSFLVLWEVMSVLSYLTVIFHDLDPASSSAAYVMLGASEAGFLAVVAAFVPLALHAHAISFTAIAARDATVPLAPGLAGAVFLLSALGFGVKTGLFPTMSWLPRAHPVAPANGSAVLSAVILNLGVYGIILTEAVLSPATDLWQGLTLLVLGAVTALVGVLYAATDNHIKRLLAHSSVENLGLVITAVGAALAFDAAHLPVLGDIAWVAALYQLLNHSVYKALLFLGAGAIDHATGHLDIDQLGGLGRSMRWTAGLMLVGTVAIASLPPLNGFVSEWLILETLLRSVDFHQPVVESLFAVGGVLVALTAGLAATAFARFYGMIFLGRPRSEGARTAADVPAGPRWAMGILAGLALVLGLAPTYVAAGLGRLAQSLTGTPAAAGLSPSFFAPGRTLAPAFLATFHDLGAQIGRAILPAPGLVFLHQGTHPSSHVVFAMAPSYLAVAFGVAIGITALLVRYVRPRVTREHKVPWTGGVRPLAPNVGYTATGFSSPMRAIFRAVLNPSQPADEEEHRARHFPTVIRREVDEVYAVDRWIVNPAAWMTQRVARLLARLHHGSVNAYVAYVLVTLVLALLAVRLG